MLNPIMFYCAANFSSAKMQVAITRDERFYVFQIQIRPNDFALLHTWGSWYPQGIKAQFSQHVVDKIQDFSRNFLVNNGRMKRVHCHDSCRFSQMHGILYARTFNMDGI